MRSVTVTPDILNRLMSILVGLVFALAAFSKAAAPDEFLVTVRYVLPEILAGHSAFVETTSLVVIFLESIFAVMFMMNSAGRKSLYVFALFISILTLILLKLKLDPYSPSCGCLGLLRIAGNMRHDTDWGIIRNLAILCIISVMIVDTGRRDKVFIRYG